MMCLVSGEGNSDRGSASRPGPMAILLDRLVASRMDYSLLDCGMVQFLSESDLKEKADWGPQRPPVSDHISLFVPLFGGRCSVHVEHPFRLRF